MLAVAGHSKLLLCEQLKRLINAFPHTESAMGQGKIKEK